MENKLSVSFELDENQSINFDDYSSDEFAIARMGFLATRPNSHHLEISEEVLRECAPTVLGKWLVGKYTLTKTDLEGHEPTEQILGIVPKEQEVEFVEEDGYTRAYVNVVVSKFYAKEFCEILQRDGAHSVSVEMSVVTEGGKGTDDVVKSFHIIGVTVLGTQVRPSVADSEIEFVRFAEQAESYFDKAHLTAENKEDNKIDFEEGKEGESKMEIEFAAVNIGDLWTSLWNALRHKYEGYDYTIENIYEQSNQKFALIKKYGEDALYRLDFTLTEEGLTLADEITKVEIEVVETDEIRKFAEPENVEQYRTFAGKPEKEEKDETPEADEDKTEMSDEEESKAEPEAEEEQMSEASDEEEKTEMSADEMKAKIAELEATIQERDNIIMENDTELEDLRNFKKACMEAQRATKVETVMSSVSTYMDDKTAEEYREKGMKCEFSELDGWVNEVKAFAFDKEPVKKQKKDEEEFTRMSAPIVTEKKKASTAFGRLQEKFQD